MITRFAPEHITEAIALRRDLHRHPELGFEETRTSEVIARLLDGWGFKVTTGVAKTGVVATLGDGSGPALGLRADIDALPIHELTGAEWASQTPGKMHACGHDGHTATLLLAARELANSGTGGTLHLIFQPAEENDAGAREMIADGLFDRFPCDEVYGLHNWPSLTAGTFVAHDRDMMAAFAIFSVKLTGRGGHAAMPEQSDEVIAAVTRLTNMLQDIPARFLSPLDPGVISVTQVNAGTAWNVCPDTAELRGTIRWFSDTANTELEKQFRRATEHIVAAYGCTVEIDYQRRYPATVNTPACAEIARSVAAEMGLDQPAVTASMASEDFSFMLQEAKGAYVWLGTAQSDNTPGLHSPYFDFNDEMLGIGAEFWCKLHDKFFTHLG
ncbi:MAG: amidohydrolase [Cognatishimia sp.]